MFKKLFILLLFTASSAFSVGIYLEEDASTGIYYDSTTQQYMLIPQCDVKFALRFDNSDGVVEPLLQASFRLYVDNDHDLTPDPGVLFKPVTVSGTYNYPWLNCDGFFPMMAGDVANSANGSGADTVGVFGLSGDNSIGYPAGYNEIVLTINTGELEPGSTFCLDSAYFDDLIEWIWGSGVIPEWGGPYCLEVADIPIDPPVVTNLPPDTLVLNYCGTNSYDFETENDLGEYLLNLPVGNLNANSGKWSYNIDPAEDGQTFEIDFTVYQGFPCLGATHVIPCKIDITASHVLLDLDQNCQTDVSDLVYFIDYMFNSGDTPDIMELADCNGDGSIDVSDLVHAIDYFFNEGSPPVNPWE